jgi:Cys-rich four helix bundle protein (predicted Tat secretion target)
MIIPARAGCIAHEYRDQKEERMTRRELMKVIGMAGVASAIVHSGVAADKPTEMHPPKYKALEATTSKCVETGNDCIRHCLSMMKMKDTTMAQCADSSVQLVAACTALQTLASVNSPFTPAFAKDVAAVCAACEKECRKFYDKYVECRACADACKACEAECHKIA